jgi:hypothetical protein
MLVSVKRTHSEGSLISCGGTELRGMSPRVTESVKPSCSLKTTFQPLFLKTTHIQNSCGFKPTLVIMKWGHNMEGWSLSDSLEKDRRNIFLDHFLEEFLVLSSRARR